MYVFVCPQRETRFGARRQLEKDDIRVMSSVFIRATRQRVAVAWHGVVDYRVQCRLPLGSSTQRYVIRLSSSVLTPSSSHHLYIHVEHAYRPLSYVPLVDYERKGVSAFVRRSALTAWPVQDCSHYIPDGEDNVGFMVRALNC